MLKNHKIALSILCSLLFLHLAQAQNGVLTGKVLDGQTKEVLISATITAGDIGELSDIDGQYRLSLAEGEHLIQVRYLGYHEFSTTIQIKAGQTIAQDFLLTEQATLLETATVSSSRFEKPLGEVTVSMDVLRPNLIESTSKLSLDDALQKIPGVTVIDGQANIRGGSGYSQGAGSRVLLLMDDVPILQADAGYPNWEDVPVEVIEQVEVVKGASSALYGSSALNGIVNVRTAYAKSEPITKAAVFSTVYLSPKRDELKWWDGEDTPRIIGANLSHRQKLGKVDLVVGAHYQNEESYRKDFYNKFGRFNFNVRHRISDRLSYGIAANINKGERGSYFYWAGLDSAYVGTASTIGNSERLRYNIDPSVLYFDKAGNRHRLLGRFYHVDNENDRQQNNKSDLYYGEYQFQKNYEDLDLVLSAGLVASGTKVEAELYGDTTFTSRNFASYIQLDKKFFDKLNVSLGARYEHNVLENPGFSYELNGETIAVQASDETESNPVFRLGLNYQAAKATYLRASWGQGYRYPTIAERYIFTDAGGFFIQPSPNLGSETGWSTELGIKQGYQIGGFQGFVDIAGFYMAYSDMIEFNWTGSGFQSINIGDTNIKGIEASIAGKGKLGSIPFQLLTGYTYIDPKFDEFNADADITDTSTAAMNAQNSSSDENILKYRFKHTFKFDGELQFGKFKVGTETTFTSSISAVDALFNVFIPGLKQFREENQNGYWYHNFRLAYQHNEHLKASFILGNAFNKEYVIRPAILEAPRNMTLRLDYKF